MKVSALAACCVVVVAGCASASASGQRSLQASGLPVVNIAADCAVTDVQLNGTSVCPTVPVDTTVPDTTLPTATTVGPQPTTTVAPTTAPATTTTVPTATTAAATTTTTTLVPTTTAVPGGFPNSATTGVPSGVALSTYTGPCTITVANTAIDAKIINCDLIVRASGVNVTRSRINGSIATDENSTGYSFSISDSDVIAGSRQVTAVGAVNFTMLRVEVVGGNRSVNCWKVCDVQESYVHAQFTDWSGQAHESGIRMGADNVIRHNTILCDAPDIAPDAGCSADLTGYGDFAPVQRVTVDNNLLKASTGGTCAYGGSSKGKPYSLQANNIKFTNNVFEHGPGGHCGSYFAITDFDPSRPGNVWTNNTWSTGGTVPNDG